MAAGTWEALTKSFDENDLAKPTSFRDFCRGLPDVEERVHSADIAFARVRTFASAYVNGHYLELGIELLRQVRDPPPSTAFPTSRGRFGCTGTACDASISLTTAFSRYCARPGRPLGLHPMNAVRRSASAWLRRWR